MFVARVIVPQLQPRVLATVLPVLVLVQHITVKQLQPRVLAIVTLVLVLVQNIAVQQVMLFAQIQLPHVAVQAVVQCLIVLHVPLIHMVYADIQLVVVILVPKHMIMMLPAPPVILVAVALVLRMSQLASLASIALLHTIAAMGMAHAPPHRTVDVRIRALQAARLIALQNRMWGGA